MDAVYKPRKVTEVNRKFLFSITSAEITLELLVKLFAYTVKTEPIFQPNDFFTLPKGTLYNTDDLETTAGRYIFNKFVITEKLGGLLGYQNDALNGNGLGSLDTTMSNLLLSDDITVEDFTQYIDKMQWLGFATSKFINASLTTDLMTPTQNIRDLKAKLLDDNREKIEAKDISTISSIENQLLSAAKNELSQLPDMEIYNSGSRGSFDNNYKQTAIARGVIRSVSNPDEIYVSMDSLSDGINPDEIYKYADLLTSASYSRALGTRTGGYEAKKISSAFQNIVFDEKGSDCRTKLSIPLKITKANTELLTNRYIMVSGKPKLITPENIDSYIGKVVQLRSPMICNGEKMCNICAGELYYQMGIENVGLVSNIVGSSMTTLELKRFHNSTIKLNEINIDDYID